MNIDIKLHNGDLPDQLTLSDNISVDCEFMGLNVKRDPLCLIQISSGNSDAHIIQLDRSNYNAPNLIKILSDEKYKELGKNAYQFSKEFSWEKIIKKYINLI